MSSSCQSLEVESGGAVKVAKTRVRARAEARAETGGSKARASKTGASKARARV